MPPKQINHRNHYWLHAEPLKRQTFEDFINNNYNNKVKEYKVEFDNIKELGNRLEEFFNNEIKNLNLRVGNLEKEVKVIKDISFEHTKQISNNSAAIFQINKVVGQIQNQISRPSSPKLLSSKLPPQKISSQKTPQKNQDKKFNLERLDEDYIFDNE
ncbi:17878_t:CDS:2 [Funneliformis caledonium]|uniref:17878_t:CDS:1 n=1 Tax=Funneliformis caledonium TaxID=1117310 RepID=A0A9N9CY04_9GLOM|nr:17878_t:CDS:2 [Funneliformis caledonium]